MAVLFPLHFPPVRVLCETVRCRYRVLVHSSVADQASQAHRAALQGERNDTAPQLTLTIMWKGGEGRVQGVWCQLAV